MTERLTEPSSYALMRFYVATDGSTPCLRGLMERRWVLRDTVAEVNEDAFHLSRQHLRVVIWELECKPVHRVRFEMKRESIAEGEKP